LSSIRLTFYPVRAGALAQAAAWNHVLWHRKSDFPEAQRVKLRTTNVIERCFREVRRRTRPIGCFTNAASCDRIIYAVFHRLNTLWQDRPLKEFTQFT